MTLDNGVVATLAMPASDSAVPAVLMLHGFASVRDEVGEMYKRLAAELGERGIASLRIDFRGWGESGCHDRQHRQRYGRRCRRRP